MKLILTNFERQEIIYWLLCETIPNRLESYDAIKIFKRRAAKIFYCSVESLLFFKNGPDSYLRFFTDQEEIFKIDFITLKHVESGHAGRDGLYHFLKKSIWFH
ncbi:hypothetical protein DMUE_4987 [Dictyocoela muelleri]|nr:hypothetical protein DMUE_4987 [Dictyocoela muelleri]